MKDSCYWDVEGRAIRSTEHEGRWQVGKPAIYENDLERFAVIYTLESDSPDDYGAYRPVGEWLVEFFRKWDAQNRAYRDAWEKEWAGHDALLEKGRVWQDEPAALEGLDKMYVNMSERHTRYPGRGADFREKP
jgi:hypothetical protein